MSTKTIKTIYWTLAILFCLFSVVDAIGGLTKQKQGVDAMHQLGYPIYLMSFLGALKILGVIALLQNNFKIIKEWAFAGFAFSLIGASVSHACVNDKPLFIIMPLIFLTILFAIYYCWRKLEASKTL